jgi:hypothetical protein
MKFLSLFLSKIEELADLGCNIFAILRTNLLQIRSWMSH